MRGEHPEVLAALEHWLAAHPGVPVDITRDALYSPTELYDAAEYDTTTDARAYAWSREPRSRQEATAQALSIWHAINEPNLLQNIRPTRSRAKLVLRKDSDHKVSSVLLRKR